MNQSTNTQVIHLTLWHGINPPPNRDVFQKLVDQFNQTHSNIQVESLYIGQADQQLPKILTAVIGKAAPDILWFDSAITGQLVELDAIQPIENWLDQLPLKKYIDPQLLPAMTLKGHTWSIPMATNNVAIFYRPDLFQEAGITELPQTWTEFREVAQKLTKDINNDGQIDRYGMLLPLGKGGWTVFTYLPFMFSAGGELVENEQPKLNNQGAIAALQFWSDLITDGSAILSPPERGYELDNLISGKVAMQITGPWTLGELEQLKLNYGVFPIPFDKKRATVIGGEHLFVMKTTATQEQAALEFLEYVLSEDFQIQWSLGTGYLPINLKARESETYRAFVEQQSVLKVFLDQTQVARSRPIIAGYSRLSEILGRAIEETLLKHDPETALNKAQQRIDLIWQNN